MRERDRTCVKLKELIWFSLTTYMLSEYIFIILKYS